MIFIVNFISILQARKIIFIVCGIMFILCITVLFHCTDNSSIQTYHINATRFYKQTRSDFLNRTFCGKFISNKWNQSINDTFIHQQNQYLKRQIEYLQNQHENQTCAEFITNNGFHSKTITNLEWNNSMAFSILIYKNFYQFQVLMRTLYVRSNFHCIHVDKGSPNHFHSYARKLSQCLSNVYVIHQSFKVNWGSLDVLQVERLCQRLLLKKSSKWHYYMTIAGSELPIQTNLNRIQILNLVQNKSRVDVSSFPQPFNRQKAKKTRPPYNMTIYKGEFHSILTREFIRALHTHRLASALWSYLNGTIVPDEHFTPTLVRIADFPGSKARLVPSYGYTRLLSHYKIWFSTKRLHCESQQYYRSICQFNYKDLSNIERSGRLFANKFNQDSDLVGIDCWEQWFNIKQTDPLDIHPENYINKYPFLQTSSNSVVFSEQIKN